MSSLKVDALRSGLMALMPSDVPAQLQRPTTNGNAPAVCSKPLGWFEGGRGNEDGA